MRVAICDDDYTFLLGTQRRLATWSEGRGIPVECRFFITPSEFMVEALSPQPPFDVVFLNVDMGFWDGINIARALRDAGSRMLVVLVSAYLRFATEGYSVDAFRYLLKDTLDDTFPGAMDAVAARLAPGGGSVEVRVRKEVHHLPLEDILYIESDKRTVTFVRTAALPLTSYRKLSDIEAELRGKGFLQIHKSFIVNLRHVAGVKNYIVTLDNGAVLQTSRQNFRAIADAWRQWKEVR